MQKINKISMVLASILALGVSSNAFAQKAPKATGDIPSVKPALTDRLELNEKKNELTVFGYYNQPTAPSGQDASITINLGYGKRLGERFVLGGSLMTTKSGANTMNFVGVGAKYYFKIGKKGDFVPFAAAGLNIGSGSNLTIMQIEGGGGASYFLTETTSMDLRAVYQMGTMKSGTVSVTSSGINALFGITQRF